MRNEAENKWDLRTLLDTRTTLLTKIRVHRTIMWVFFSILRRASYDRPAQRAAVRNIWRILRADNRDISPTSLRGVFDRSQTQLAWRQAKAMIMEKFAERRTVAVSDPEAAACAVCFANVPDFVLVHADGETAHGGVCGSCALRVMVHWLEQNPPRCFLCNQRVRMVCPRSCSRARRLDVFPRP